MKSLLLLLALACGCGTAPRIDTICWSEDLSGHIDEWEDRVRRDRRFKHSGALLLVVHGEDNPREWWFRPDGFGRLDPSTTAKVVRLMSRDNRPLVIIACNPSGQRIWVNRTWFATTTVWGPPGVTPRFPGTQPWTSNLNDWVEGRGE